MTDLNTFLRQSIGFNNLINAAGVAAVTSTNFPPFNIEQLSSDRYRLTLAVAGFKKDDISITVEDGILTIESDRFTKTKYCENSFIHHGIAARDFAKSWKLGDYVEVSGAELEDGLLVVTLERQVPEALKARKISIS